MIDHQAIEKLDQLDFKRFSKIFKLKPIQQTVDFWINSSINHDLQNASKKI
jgi:hypothetical protein